MQPSPIPLAFQSLLSCLWRQMAKNVIASKRLAEKI
jgi:hypothetical protein